MYIIYYYILKLNVIDSGSQKMQRTCKPQRMQTLMINQPRR